MIIDHLCEDKPTLQSCAIVCKEWLPSSRYHLFGELSIKGANYHHEQFLEFLQGATHIAPYIRSLLLAGSIDATILLDLLRLLQDLIEVRLFDLGVDGGSTTLDDMIVALLSMKNLTYLYIYGDFPQCSQPSTVPYSVAPVGPSNLRSLQTFMFPKMNMPQLWRAIAQSKAAPRSVPLDVLDVPIDLCDESCDIIVAHEFSNFLREVGSEIKILTMDFRAVSPDVFFSECNSNIPPNTN